MESPELQTKDVPQALIEDGEAARLAAISTVSRSIGGFVDLTGAISGDLYRLPLTSLAYTKLVQIRERLLEISAYNLSETPEQVLSKQRVYGQLSAIDNFLIHAQIISD